MTAYFQNRKVAAIITVVLCVLFLLLGMNRSVAKQAKLYTNAFYEGVYVKDGGYTSAALADILGSCSTYALTLSSIYADCPAVADEVDALTQARRNLVDAIDAGDISDMYGAYRAVSAAAQALTTAGADAELSGNDRSKADDAMAKFTSAEGAIGQNPYNSYIEEYYTKVENTLPMRILGFLVFADGPEYFAHEEL